MFRLVAISIISLVMLAGSISAADLTFGCSREDLGSFTLTIVDALMGARYSPSSAGTLDSAFVYIGGTSRQFRVCCYNVNSNDTTLVDSTDIVTNSGAPTWRKLTFQLGGEVHPDSSYLLAGNAEDTDGGFVMYFALVNDSCGTPDWVYETSWSFTSNAWPTTFGDFSGGNTRDVGIYAWYHTAAAPEGVSKYKQGPAEGSVAQSAKGSSPRQGP